jgi:hypothetical protein
MLRPGDDVFGSAEFRPLESADLGHSHRRTQVRVLSRALDHPSPSWIAGNIDHRRERPVNADGAGLTRRHRLRPLYDRRVPRRRHRDRDREDRAQPVDHVEAEQRRDPVPVAVYGQPLQPVGLGRISDEEQ